VASRPVWSQCGPSSDIKSDFQHLNRNINNTTVLGDANYIEYRQREKIFGYSGHCSTTLLSESLDGYGTSRSLTSLQKPYPAPDLHENAIEDWHLWGNICITVLLSICTLQCQQTVVQELHRYVFASRFKFRRSFL